MHTLVPSAIRSIALVANGSIEDLQVISTRVRHHSFVVAVDGGLNYCHAMKIRPDLLVGDMDSVEEKLLHLFAEVPQQRLLPNKDETDLEVALQLVDQPQIQEMVVYAGLHKRIDHSLGNLQLLRRYPGRLIMETEIERIFCVKGEVSIPCMIGQTLSLIPLGGPVNGVCSRGLRWELNQATLNAHSLSISNETMRPQVELSIPEGDLICVISSV